MCTLSPMERLITSILLGTITGSACALVSACLIKLTFKHIINKPPILKGPVVFSPQISPKSLQSSLSGPTHVPINRKYYKTVLDNGFTFAVKTLDIGCQGKTATRKMQNQLETLAGLRHRHVMSLRAYIGDVGDGFRLVYDYVDSGSLEDVLSRENGLMGVGWDARLRVAVGIVKGLQYLHFSCNPRILHYNLKPSNVLLDADFEPRLGDFGLVKNSFHGIRSSDGGCYYAPECFPNFSIYTENSDIYSFGVILGVLLTGRDPSDPLFVSGSRSGSQSQSRSRSGMGMGMWFRQVVEAGDGREALDKSLLGEETQEDEMLMAVRIAAVCMSDMPADRPSSDELVPMLTQLHSF